VRDAYIRSRQTGVPSVAVADEAISPVYWGFVTHISLKKIVSFKASQLNEAGIVAHEWNKVFKEETRMKPEKIGPQVLTLRHLEAGFILICSMLLISIVAFVVELAPKTIKGVLGPCLACYGIVKFVKMRKLF
jgi:hypothetical protein